MLETLVVGAALFASTNIDDVFLLMAFFADPQLDRRAVVTGQFLGIGALVAASALAAACALAVPHQWIALLGFAPLCLGIQRLVTTWRARSQSLSDDDEAGVQGGSIVAQAASVAAITAANGGDNLGIYIPVFAQEMDQIPLYTAIFAMMTGLWCVVGRALVTHRLVAARMRRLAGVLLPWVLIALGLWILKDAIGLVRPVPQSTAPEPSAVGVSCVPPFPCH